jgi:hypothetical protein
MHPQTTAPPQNPPTDTDPFQFKMFSQAAPNQPDQVGDTASAATADPAQPEDRRPTEK